MIARCLLGIICVATLFCLSPLFGQNTGHTVVRTFHMGPSDAPIDNDSGQSCQSDECQASGDDKFFDPPPCRYCIECHYQHWCPYCGYCPIYDDSDNAVDWENRTTWPSKHEDSWMRELVY